uniref:Integrase catalytic domain-containing protein n=1 Tax=Fundulus heteroclitus TaxID=8078 RepID=A0A3Q2Q0I0_FUNHE
MGGDVHLFVKMCPHCSACKSTGPKKRAKLQSYQVGAPLDRFSGNKYILVIIDQFTRWVEAFPIPDQDAETTAKKLVYNFIARFGPTLELHTDQGRNIESSLFRNVCRLLQITKTRSTPYHPSSNGQVERFNRTLLQMLRCYVDRNQKNWDEQLPLPTAAYRSSRHMVTGFTPNKLMLGREVHQPHDIQWGAARLKSNAMEVVDYIYKLEESLKEAQSLARSHLRTAQERQKRKGLSPKLQAVWRGPLIVAAHRGPVLYEIQECTDEVRHVHNLIRNFWYAAAMYSPISR